MLSSHPGALEDSEITATGIYLGSSLEDFGASCLWQSKCLEMFRSAGIGSGLAACSVTCEQGLPGPCGCGSTFRNSCPHGHRESVVCMGQWLCFSTWQAKLVLVAPLPSEVLSFLSSGYSQCLFCRAPSMSTPLRKLAQTPRSPGAFQGTDPSRFL